MHAAFGHSSSDLQRLQEVLGHLDAQSMLEGGRILDGSTSLVAPRQTRPRKEPMTLLYWPSPVCSCDQRLREPQTASGPGMQPSDYRLRELLNQQ